MFRYADVHIGPPQMTADKWGYGSHHADPKWYWLKVTDYGNGPAEVIDIIKDWCLREMGLLNNTSAITECVAEGMRELTNTQMNMHSISQWTGGGDEPLPREIVDEIARYAEVNVYTVIAQHVAFESLIHRTRRQRTVAAMRGGGEPILVMTGDAKQVYARMRRGCEIHIEGTKLNIDENGVMWIGDTVVSKCEIGMNALWTRWPVDVA